MTLLVATLFAFAATDLTRDRDRKQTLRAAAAVVASALAVGGLMRLAGMDWSTTVIVGLVLLLVLVGWVILDTCATSSAPAGVAVVALLWTVIALLGAFAASGALPSTGGPLKDWFSNLDIHHPKGPVALDRVMLSLSGALFLTGSGNRLVRLVYVIAGTPTQTAQTKLRGGRLIGPMERLFIGSMMVAGEPTGIAIVIAAKGLLRLPEIQRDPGKIDEFTEYFLIGTFASMLIAIAVAGAVLAVG